MKPRIVRIIGTKLIVIGAIVGCITFFVNDNMQAFFAIPGMVLIVGGRVFWAFFMKCPFCHTRLPIVILKFCPYCGNDLEL